MAAQEKRRSLSAALYCATFPNHGGGSSILLQQAPELRRAAPEHHLHRWSCLSDLSPGGRKQDISALVFVKITEGPPPPARAVGDGSRVRVPSVEARLALMMLNNILDYLVGGRGGRRHRSCRGGSKDCVYLEKLK